ncbi:MAG: hypothetical protein Q7R40_20110 [Phaeospirillum sp.]|nr:hypothetical protein [Phaeospirillum sp.]
MHELNHREIKALDHCCGDMPESLDAFPGAGKKTIERLLRLKYLRFTEKPGYTHGEYVERTPEGKAALDRCR